MRRYVKADLLRTYRRVPRNILVYLILVLVILLVGFTGDTDTAVQAWASYMAGYSYLTVVIGLIEIVFVYGDDFKAKTMQMAIGTGLKRQKIVHAKWIEFMILTATDILVFFILEVLFVGFLFGMPDASGWTNTFIVMFMTWLTMNAALGTIMFVMFWAQGISLTLLLYILAAGNLIPSLIQFGTQAIGLSKFHLHSYTLPNMIQTFQARLILGHISWSNLIGILIYLVIGFTLASIVFKKKELEF